MWIIFLFDCLKCSYRLKIIIERFNNKTNGSTSSVFNTPVLNENINSILNHQSLKSVELDLTLNYEKKNRSISLNIIQ